MVAQEECNDMDCNKLYNFSEVLRELEKGFKFRRIKWDEKDIVGFISLDVEQRIIYKYDGEFYLPYAPNSDDMLSNDWLIVGRNKD